MSHLKSKKQVKLILMIYFAYASLSSIFEHAINKKMIEIFYVLFFHTMSLEFTLSFVLMAHLGSDQLHFRCPIATCDSALLYWTVQAYSFKLFFISWSVSTVVWIAKDKEECRVGDIVSSTQLYLKKGLSLS